jgi:hypothetical protein
MMTNEERIEERLIHAHERGYYEAAMKKFKSLEMLHPKMDRYKLYEMACDECKEEWLKENNNE